MLHLTAFDAEDLAVISAQMQDAVIRFGDMKYLIKQRQFALVANRFAWDALPERVRRRSGLQISDIKSVKRQGPQMPEQHTILSFLAVTFEPDASDKDGLAGSLTMTFSGGHAFAFAVDSINVHLDDLGPAWSTDATPGHDT